MNGTTELLGKASWFAPAETGDTVARSRAPAHISLCDLARGACATVADVMRPPAGEDHDVVLRLIEIGFVPGERVRVIAHGFPGREPIAVRVGDATFALRRFEADYIRVTVDNPLVSPV